MSIQLFRHGVVTGYKEIRLSERFLDPCPNLAAITVEEVWQIFESLILESRVRAFDSLLGFIPRQLAASSGHPGIFQSCEKYPGSIQYSHLDSPPEADRRL
ncbi:MAG: hypothetical protein HY978_03200, partial [Candidatus Liptonbacteria bacterium]|nr:hypothetical protein [Candidatus Liptonbacteria bacterium]